MEHRRVFRTTIGQASALKMGEAYTAMTRHIFFPIPERFHVPPEDRAYMISFYIHGLAAIINDWLMRDCADSIEQITRIMRRCTIGGRSGIGMSYPVIRSNRKSLAIEIRCGEVVIRAPLKVSDDEIRAFVQKHQAWIEKQLEQAARRQEALGQTEPLTMDEIRALADKALQVIPERVRFYAPKVGVTYGRITIRNQRSKWGSCTGTGNLNFNCLLMLMPPQVLDSVVVHELCHRKEMNHSQRFYAEVLRVFPEYRVWEQWLKDNGEVLIRRMTAGAGR